MSNVLETDSRIYKIYLVLSHVAAFIPYDLGDGDIGVTVYFSGGGHTEHLFRDRVERDQFCQQLTDGLANLSKP